VPTLFEIEAQISEIMSSINDTAEGIDSEEELAGFMQHVESTLAQLGEDKAAKIDAYGQLLSMLGSEEQRLKGIIDGLMRRKASLINKQQRVKEHLKGVMEQFGEKKIEGSVFIARLSERKVVDVINEEIIPHNFLRVKYEPDKTLLAESLKEGVLIPGVQLKESKSVSVRAA